MNDSDSLEYYLIGYFLEVRGVRIHENRSYKLVKASSFEEAVNKLLKTEPNAISTVNETID